MKTKRFALIAATVLTSTTFVVANPTGHNEADKAHRIALERADRMAHSTLNSLSRSRDECHVVANLAANATVFDLRSDLSKAVASCVNEESGSPQKFFACLEEAFEEFSEGLDLLEEQHAARLDLCALTGGGIYDPDLEEDEFSTIVDNEYAPFLEGAIWVYQLNTPEGLEEITVSVSGETMCIDDIECISVQDVVTLDGVVIEDTIDWYAQHDDGAVWYMGEIAQNFEEGVLVDVDGSWRAGEDGGLPGIIMMATPTPGTTYRQELLLTEAEDAGTVLATGLTVTIGMGTFTDCIQTEDFSPVEPDALEYKYYAPGIGLILEEDPETGDRLELVSFTPGS